MNQSSTGIDVVGATDDQSSALRELVVAIALTPLLLLPEPARAVVSLEATLAAVVVGVVVGVIVSVALDPVEIRPQSDAVAAVGTLVAIVVATAFLWLVLPVEHTGTFIQFVIAFLWGSSLTSVTRHVVRPALSGSRTPAK
ncbi:hypothetical protein AB7C87_18565 [Natrarchaeobius sp. A-rgal3]|uniref:hypothetical protein n=1 Tax=Natrarchaeobius versutus TaxID=1679078 RepID=UPI00350F2E19